MTLSTYTWVFQDILDNREYFERETDRAIHEMAESLLPVYYNEVAEQWQALPMADTDRWQEIGVSDNATIYDRMSTDLFIYYEALVSRAWAEVQETHTCDTEAPDTITVSPSGAIATCSECSFKSALWECACELVHECEA